MLHASRIVRSNFPVDQKGFLSLSLEPQWITGVDKLSAFVGNAFLGRLTPGPIREAVSMVLSAPVSHAPRIVRSNFPADQKNFLSKSLEPQWITSIGHLSVFVGNSSVRSIIRGWDRSLEVVCA